jgi:hypothetical protein
MKAELTLKLELLKKQARANSGKKYLHSSRSNSSLHQLIKTKKQAEQLMKQLESA